MGNFLFHFSEFQILSDFLEKPVMCGPKGDDPVTNVKLLMETENGGR